MNTHKADKSFYLYYVYTDFTVLPYITKTNLICENQYLERLAHTKLISA